MLCPQCHSENSSNASQCQKCGTALGSLPKPADEERTITSVPGTEWSKPLSQTVIGRLGSITQLSAGTLLGERYEILALLGEGGMGAVYKARDREVGHLVALKVIRPELANQKDILNRFKQELILARQVTHKNIVRIFDLGQAEGIKFITMEFVEGQDLHSLMRKGHQFTLAEKVKIIHQVCRALDAAHAEGVVHRDLKPHNIMVESNGRVVVMDFGVARSMDGTGGQTSTGALIGTPAYMSPEQAKGEKVDTRSDLFSLGVIFYELLTNRPPYESETVVGLLLKRVQERPIPPIEHDTAIPAGLSEIVMKCLAVDLTQRYQAAKEIQQDLENWQGSPETFHTVIHTLRPEARVGVTPEGRAIVTPKMAMMAQSSTWKWITLSVAAVIVIAGGVFAGMRFFAKPQGPHSPVTVLVADFANHTGDPIFDGTLEPMFNVALEGASFINTFNRGEARKLAAQLPHPADKLDEQSARLIAVSQGLGAVVTGAVSRRADGYKISAEVLDALTGNTVSDVEVSAANKDDVMLAIPKLAAPVRTALGDTTPASVQLTAATGPFTAASLETVHQYGIGMEQQLAGKYEEAWRSFSKTGELDPNFARAYSGMAAMSRNLGRPQDAQKEIGLAMQHADRMTERERYRTRALLYFVIGDERKCVEEYSTMLNQYPADNLAHNNLAVCYAQLRDMPKAAEEMKKAVSITPKASMQRMNLALLDSYAGNFQAAESEARAAQQLNPANEEFYLNLAYTQLGQDRLDQATDSYEKLAKIGARGASLAAAGSGDLALYQGRFSEAVNIFEKSAAAELGSKPADAAADRLVMSAYAQLSFGRKAPAASAAERALANSKSVKVRFLAARTLAAAGETAKARELAASLAAEPVPEPQTYAKLIEGEIALQENNPSQAVKLFIDANTILNTWIGRFDLGRGYLEAGSFAEADSEFDTCLKRRGEALELFMDDMPTYSYLPPVYYYYGRTREAEKNAAGAKDFYQMYLNIRGKTGEDPLLAEVRRHAGQ